MAGGAATPSGGHPFKNVIIGVITTVISATVIYFLGFHDPEKDDVKKAKQSTIEAWESLMTYERSFKNASTRMLCSGDAEAMAKDILDEYEKIIGNIANIKDEKKEKADNRIISLIDRRLATLKEKKDATAEYFKTLYDLDSSGLPQQELNARIIQHENDFMKRMGELENQDNDFVSEINADLKKKYRVEFKYPPPFQLKPELLIGNWTIDREINLDLKKDKDFSWIKPDGSFKGTWALDTLTLRFSFSDGEKYNYELTGGNDKVILMKLLADNSFHYMCR